MRRKTDTVRRVAKRQPTKAELAAMRQQVESLVAGYRKRRNACRELVGEGSRPIHRAIIELHQLTGVNPADLTPHEFDNYVEAAIQRKKTNSDLWVILKLSDCIPDRSTMLRHANDPAMPWIEREGRGKYRVRKSHESDYRKPA